MAGEKLRGPFFTPNRDGIVRQYEKDWRFRQPTARVGDGTYPTTRAKVTADTVLPIYASLISLANDIDFENKSREGLVDELARRGLPPPFEAVGGNGFVSIFASAGGGTIFRGDILSDPDSGLRFQCTTTRKYADGQPVPIEGLDTGPTTNLKAGTTLKWERPRPGIAPSCIVLARPNGKGLEGGREGETDAEIVRRLKAAASSPAAAGNDADVQQKAASTPGVPVQAVFTYPGTDGPGTTCFAILLAPAEVGGSRAPTAVQNTAARVQVVGAFAKDDGYIDLMVVEVPTDLMLRVRWSPDADGWEDAVPWPPYVGGGGVQMKVSSVVSPLQFEVTTPTVPVVPQPGQTFGFFDSASGTWKRKTVLSTYAVDPFTIGILCDGTNGESDLDFLPVVDDIPSPWSDSLDLLVAPVLEAFAGLGPGELFTAPFFDEGYRQKRNPQPPAWPYELSSRSFRALDEVTGASSIQIVDPAIPYSTPVGTPNVSVNLLKLGRLSVFAV